MHPSRQLPNPPSGMSVRPARPDDAATVESIINELTERDVGMVAYQPGELAEEWRSEESAAAHLVVEDENGAIAGVLWMEPLDESLYGEMFVTPSKDAQLLQPCLIDLAEASAMSESERRGGPIKLSLNVNTALPRRLLDRRGYRRGMQDHAMFMDLDNLDFEPWPRAVGLREYEEGADDLLMYETMREGFAGDWDGAEDAREWIRRHREAQGYRPELWFFATANGEITGAIQCRDRWHGATDTGWIKNLAVLPDRRRLGIGRALLGEAFRRLRSLGRARAVLGVTASNPTRARDFYLRIGMYERGSSTDHEKTFDSTRRRDG